MVLVTRHDLVVPTRLPLLRPPWSSAWATPSWISSSCRSRKRACASSISSPEDACRRHQQTSTRCSRRLAAAVATGGGQKGKKTDPGRPSSQMARAHLSISLRPPPPKHLNKTTTTASRAAAPPT